MNEVKRQRKLKGLSQVELAELAGVSAYTITEIETGHRDPRGSTLRKLAAALDVEVADFFPKAQAPPSQPEEAGEAAQRVLEEGSLRIFVRQKIEQADEEELAAAAAIFYELVAAKDPGGHDGSDRRELKERLNRAAQAGLDAIGGPEAKS